MARHVVARSAVWKLAPLLLATACGTVGLDPTQGEAGFDGDEEAQQLAEVEVSLTGLTYAAAMADVKVLEPVGLDALLHDNVSGSLLFHVVDEDLDTLTLAMTMGDDEGQQDTCVDVFELPEADWSSNPELAIEGGRTEIEIANQPVELSSLSLISVVSLDGERWESASLRTLLDTRDLLGGSLDEDADVCALVENMGGECRECPDGAMACAVLELELDAQRVDTSFDMDPSGC